jgi:protein-disulfide isomerase
MLRDLPGLIWIFDNSDAFTDVLFDFGSIIIGIKEETFKMKKQYMVLISIVFLILLFVLGINLYKSQQIRKYGFMARENASTFVREHSQTLGSDDAKVYLVEFSDPACETCSAFHPFVKNLMAANPGKIKLVVRYAPFHDGADYFVKILEAARKQGKYWETLEVMYQTQRYWASHSNPQPKLIWKFLPRAGLDLVKIRNDMNDPEIAKLIQQDLADAKALKVRKTPGFFVNGKPLPSFGYKQLKELVESEINEYY